MNDKRSIRGNGERAWQERRRTARRLLNAPEQVTQEEARGFLEWITADFEAFEERRKLRAVKKTANRRGGRA